MRWIIVFILIPIIHFSVDMYLYKARYMGVDLVVGRFIECYGIPVQLTDNATLETVEVSLPEPTLVKLRDGDEGTLLLVHGLAFMEYIQGAWTEYKMDFRDSVLKVLDDLDWKPAVYMYIYPSLLESYWISGRRLAEFSKDLKLKDITILAHSRGGLVARVALRDPDFRSKVRKAIFLGTPHFGSPFSDSLIVDPRDFESYFNTSKRVADLMRLTLAMSYTVGLSSSPGSRDMKWMDPSLPPFENYPNVEYILVAGFIKIEDLEDIAKAIENIVETRTFRVGTALVYMSFLSELISHFNEEFTFTDGLVPVSSALAFGKLKGRKILLPGYSHVSLYRDPKVLKLVLEGK